MAKKETQQEEILEEKKTKKTAKKSAAKKAEPKEEPGTAEEYEEFGEEDPDSLPADEMEEFQGQLQQLIAIGKKKDNVLDYQEVVDHFRDLNLDDEKYDLIIQMLEQQGIDVLRVQESDDEVPDEELEMIEEGDEDTEPELIDLSIPDTVNIDDPVRMYLKEIGKVPLLSAEQEIDLAQAMEYGALAEKVLAAQERESLSLTREEKEFLEGKTDEELKELI
ncbi:MAG: hypothetical protein J6M46_04500, partial [Lachnospiraceae bacterium]|nr:hypothetical protein [Lachnospiraceae bacterium]